MEHTCIAYTAEYPLQKDVFGEDVKTCVSKDVLKQNTAYNFLD